MVLCATKSKPKKYKVNRVGKYWVLGIDFRKKNKAAKKEYIIKIYINVGVGVGVGGGERVVRLTGKELTTG